MVVISLFFQYLHFKHSHLRELCIYISIKCILFVQFCSYILPTCKKQIRIISHYNKAFSPIPYSTLLMTLNLSDVLV